MDKIVISIILCVIYVAICAIFFRVLYDNWVKKRKKQAKQPNSGLATRTKEEHDKRISDTYKRITRESVSTSTNYRNSVLPHDVPHHSESVTSSSFGCFSSSSNSSNSSCGGGGE